MNVLACVYLENSKAKIEDFQIEKISHLANSARLCIYFSDENTDFEKSIWNKSQNVGFLKSMSTVDVHECITPFLIVNFFNNDPLSARSKLPVQSKLQKFWINEIDIWYNLPEKMEHFLKPLIPHAYFIKLAPDALV